MPRFWLSGPRLFHGWVRPGISFSGREIANMGRKSPAINADALLGLFRRNTDGSIFLGMYGRNGEHELDPDLTPVAVFAFTSVDAATAAREGALTRLPKHVGTDGLIAGLSVGQVVSAIRSEAAALGLEVRFIRIAAAAAGWAPDWMSSPAGRIVGWVVILIALGLVIAAIMLD